MNDGQKILLNSLMIFGILGFLFFAFGFFIYPNLKDTVVEEESAVTSVLGEQNPHSYECPESSRILNVPEDYPSIQEAIDASVEDTIIYVAPGIYNENLVLQPKVCLISEEYGEAEIQGYKDVVIVANGENQIKNFKISNVNGRGVGIGLSESPVVSIEVNFFTNLDKAIVVMEDSRVNITANSFREVKTAIFVGDSFIYADQNNIEASNIAIEIYDSEGEILGKVINGGQYAIKARNSNILFDKNIFKNQEVAGMDLCRNGEYTFGSNFFENVDEEIFYN